MNKYRIYPSLLNQFQEFLDSDLEAEEFWNIDEDGNYKRSVDEITRDNELDLIDNVNRVEHEAIEACDKGTAFNEVIDCIVEGRQSSNPDIVITSERDEMGNTYAVKAVMNGFTFLFDAEMCREVARYFQGSLCQYYTEATMTTKYGDVLLYGYIDEWQRDRICDIKTTGRYQFPKFDKGWQKSVYPWCVIESGMTDNIAEFEYTVIVLSKPSGRTPVMKGTMYKEVYTYDHERNTRDLNAILERFIEWLEQHREYITSQRIFGGENPDDYVAVPIRETLGIS